MDKDFSRRAIAYLKAEARSGPSTVPLSQADSPVLRPFAEGLLVAYVVDTGKALAYVQQRHLAADKLNEEELHRIGVANLTALAGHGNTQVHPYRGMFAVTMGGNFEASLLALDHLWDGQLGAMAPGEIAAAIPARDLLAFCSAGSAEGMAELRAMIGRAGAVDHPLTNRIYLRRDRQWVGEPLS